MVLVLLSVYSSAVFSERRWCDDQIVSLLVLLATMMVQTVLALSDYFLHNLIF